MWFLFSVIAYAFILLVLFIVKKSLKIIKNGYVWEWVIIYADLFQ